MDRTELDLTTDQIELGKKVLEKFDSSDIQITSAFWYLTPNLGWSYVLSSPQFDLLAANVAYEKLQEQLATILEPGSTFINNVSIVKTNQPPVSLVRVAINTGPKAISGIRFSNNVINNQYVKDAYIYRIS